MIPDSERQQLAQIRNQNKQQESLVTRAVLRLLLADLIDTAASDLQFDYLPHGKPVLADQSVPCQFNISHSRHQAAIAITENRPVGIDLQWHRESVDYLAFSQRFFHPEETAMLLTLDSESARTHYFYALWTGKEALFKADGRGIAVSDLQTGLPGIMTTPVDVTLAPTRYCVQLLPQLDDFSWAVATADCCLDYHWQHWVHPET